MLFGKDRNPTLRQKEKLDETNCRPIVYNTYLKTLEFPGAPPTLGLSRFEKK